MGFWDRLQHGWNAFRSNRDPTLDHYNGYSYTYRPDRPRLSRGSERSIVAAVQNRIATDVASISVLHCKLDKDNGQLEKIMKTGLNNCLTVEANIDQSARAFLFDVALSVLNEGVIAVVPVETTLNPENTASYDITSMRTGKILQWKPQHVQVRLYDDRDGEKKDIWVAKQNVAIIENPFYAVMNEPNSIGQRLIEKLRLLDAIDTQSGSGKLDLIIQLPYAVKSDLRKKQAEERRNDIKNQIANDQFGIAYIDGTEKVTQLNRPVENNLLKQIEYLTSMLYSQLGMTQSILDNTADEQTQLNYMYRTVEPIISAIVDEMKRKFLTKTARSQGQTIKFFRDPFKLVPINNIADIADKFTRNEIVTSNEFRQIVGMMPSDDPKADQLENSNIRHPDEGKPSESKVTEESEEGGENQNGQGKRIKS